MSLPMRGCLALIICLLGGALVLRAACIKKCRELDATANPPEAVYMASQVNGLTICYTYDDLTAHVMYTNTPTGGELSLTGNLITRFKYDNCDTICVPVPAGTQQMTRGGMQVSAVEDDQKVCLTATAGGGGIP